jgi:hypothetical protein
MTPLTCDAGCSKFRLLLIFDSAQSELSIWKFGNTRMPLLKGRTIKNPMLKRSGCPLQCQSEFAIGEGNETADDSTAAPSAAVLGYF